MNKFKPEIFRRYSFVFAKSPEYCAQITDSHGQKGNTDGWLGASSEWVAFYDFKGSTVLSEKTATLDSLSAESHTILNNLRRMDFFENSVTQWNSAIHPSFPYTIDTRPMAVTDVLMRALITTQDGASVRKALLAEYLIGREGEEDSLPLPVMSWFLAAVNGDGNWGGSKNGSWTKTRTYTLEEFETEREQILPRGGEKYLGLRDLFETILMDGGGSEETGGFVKKLSDENLPVFLSYLDSY